MNTKHKCICLIAMLLALIGIVLPEIPSLTNTTTGVIFVVNNTNLAPTFPGEPVGTGERIQNVTYWANSSPKEIFVFGHANTLNSTLSINLSINGTVVEYDQRRPIASATNSDAYVHAIIPQYASYKVNITNYHHYEWREYTILTGNVTTNITTSGSGGGCTGNCSFDNISINTLSKNDTTDLYGLYINLNNDFSRILTGVSQSYMGVADGSYFYALTQNSVSGIFSRIQVYDNNIDMDVSDGTATEYLQTDTDVTMTTVNKTYNFNNTYLDMGTSNITNINNINSTGLITVSLNSTSPDIDMRYGNDWVSESITTLSTISSNQYNVWSMNTMSNNTAHQGFFGAHRVGCDYNTYTTTSRINCALRDNTIMFTFYGKGYDGTAWAASSGRLNIVTQGNWNSTSHPTSVEIWTTGVTGAAPTKRVTVNGNGSVTVSGLSGAGNAYTCVNSAGTLYRGAPGC